jgi:hypothetical protein
MSTWCRACVFAYSSYFDPEYDCIIHRQSAGIGIGALNQN